MRPSEGSEDLMSISAVALVIGRPEVLAAPGPLLPGCSLGWLVNRMGLRGVTPPPVHMLLSQHERFSTVHACPAEHLPLDVAMQDGTHIGEDS